MRFCNIGIIDHNYEFKENYDVEIEGAYIKAISPSQADSGLQAGDYPGQGKLLCPAFFNAHCHVPMGLMRGYGEGLPLQRWLEEKIFPYEALLSPDDVYWASLLGIAELLRSGVASFSDMYMHMAGITQAVSESKIKANLSHGCAAFGQDPDFSATNAYVGTEITLAAAAADKTTKLRADLALHGEYTSNANTAQTLFTFARDQGLRVQVHLSETQKEHEECKLRRHGLTPLAYLQSCGALEVPLICAHGVWLEACDFELLSQSRSEGKDITLVHNPSSNCKLASGLPTLKAWQATGVNIALGTDGASSNNNLNMLEEIHLAGLLQKHVQRDPAFLPAETLLQIATRGGALAQGRSDCGLLAPAHKADLIVFDLAKAHLQPLLNPVANLFFAAQSEDIELTMVDGEILYHQGELLSIDMERVLFEVRRITQNKLSQLCPKA